LEIARKLVRVRGYWRTTYASAYGDSSYTLPDLPTFDVITGFLDEFLEGTNDMDCQDFANELDDIEQAILSLGGSGGCGCGSGGAGATSPPADDTDTGDITLGTGTPPPGWPGWEEYQVGKCNVASMIVSDLLNDVIWWQTVTIATLTVGGLSAGMLSILSAFTLTAVLAGLLALLAYNIAFLTNAQDALTDGFEDLVCAILAGTDSQESMDNFISEMETQVDLAMSDVIARFLVKQLLGQWADATLFNLLYADYDDYLARQITTGADCSACGLGCHNFELGRGTWLGGLSFSSEFYSSYHRITIAWNMASPLYDICDPDDHCGPMELHELVTLTGHTGAGASVNDFMVWKDADCPRTAGNGTGYNSDTPPLYIEVCGRNLQFLSSTAFTATWEVKGHCF